MELYCVLLTHILLFSTAGQYLFQAPNRYIFHGAEVYSDSEDETSSSCGSDSEDSEGSVDGVEDDSDPEEDGAEAMAAADEEACFRDTLQHHSANETTDVQLNKSSEKTESFAQI